MMYDISLKKGMYSRAGSFIRYGLGLIERGALYGEDSFKGCL